MDDNTPVDGGGAADQAGESTTGESPPIEDAGGGDQGEVHEQRGEPASSVAELIESLAEATTGLEDRWAHALDADSLESARQEFARVAASVMDQLMERARRHSKVLGARGLDRLGTAFPLSAADAELLDLSPVGDQRLRQLQIGLLYSLRDFVAAAKAISDPPSREAGAVNGDRLGTWWESGGFALVRARAFSLGKVLADQEDALFAMAPELGLASDNFRPRLVPRDGASEAYGKAVTLTRLGFHDAAIPLLLQSARDLLMSQGANPIGTVSGTLKADSPDSPLVSALRRLEEASLLMGRGVGVPPEVAIPLVEIIIELLPRVVIRTVTASPIESSTGERTDDQGDEERGQSGAAD